MVFTIYFSIRRLATVLMLCFMIASCKGDRDSDNPEGHDPDAVIKMEDTVPQEDKSAPGNTEPQNDNLTKDGSTAPDDSIAENDRAAGTKGTPDNGSGLRSLTGLADTTFVRLADFSDGFAYDLRYATENNFLKEKVYECAECYTRVKTAKALLAANSDFKDEGVRIKFFDCYRPNSVQYKMWEIVPNPQYVANPEKGSIHNKGGAVDITLETLEGKELDMGTDFDFFGKRAYHDMTELPQEILDNRKLLKETMERNGFRSIRTEWWHYNLGAASNDKVANFNWPCP